MKRSALVALLLVSAFAACRGFAPAPATTGRVEGHVELPATGAGDAYLFLYRPGEGPPGAPAEPLAVSAVPEVRLAAGDGRFVFSDVPRGEYRLAGFLDVDRDFSADVDVRAQAGAGDRYLTGVSVSVTAGEVASAELSLEPGLSYAAPAFHVSGAPDAGVVSLPDQPLVPVAVALEADPVALLDPERTLFAVSLVDADGDGVGDDVNGDGIPELWPQVFARFVPRPGQSVPTDDAGTALPVIVPLPFNPAPFLLSLGTDPKREVTATALTALLVPGVQAQALGRGDAGEVLPTALPVIPIGDYELWVVAKSGQLWHLPNALAPDAGSGQAVRLRFEHGSGLGNGGP